jgi:two-component system phosphate regulon sensor histidine kinase PhoR
MIDQESKLPSTRSIRIGNHATLQVPLRLFDSVLRPLSRAAAHIPRRMFGLSSRMLGSDLDRLAALIRRERDGLLSRWRQQVREPPSAPHLDVPTLNDHVPQLIDELADALKARSDETIAEALSDASPPAHGLQRVQDGFDIEEVVAEYNILRGCIHDLAHANGLTLQGEPFHILNRVLDGAIGLAVKTFAAERALEVRGRREEYLSFVAHDLRTPLNAISLATSVLELAVPARSAGAAHAQMFKTLRRNVQHLDALVGKVIEENTGLLPELGIKLERRTFDLWPLVEALVHDLQLIAHAASTRLINQVPDELAVYADASLLRRVFQNVIGNAIAYTPRGQVVIGARQSGRNVPRVLGERQRCGHSAGAPGKSVR